jgi:hypothetical protein
MCAHCKLTESDDVSFFGHSTSEMAQRALRENNQDSTECDRKDDALTNALGTKEQRGHVRGVSSKLTKKEGLPEHKSSYWKKKTTSTPRVDMEDLKRQLRRELLGDLKPILES